MPTGYTQDIEKGITFPEYLWGCARAFGALITLRDSSGPIPETLAPSSYESRRIVELEEEKKKLLALSDKELQNMLDIEIAKTIKDNAAYLERHNTEKALYAKMQKEVEAWAPPTPDHVKLKEFMLDQIRISLPYEPPYQSALPLNDIVKWKEEKLDSIERSLARNHKGYSEELERTADRNKWLNDLRASVPMPKVKK